MLVCLLSQVSLSVKSPQALIDPLVFCLARMASSIGDSDGTLDFLPALVTLNKDYLFHFFGFT
jgi:hypothetical protein